MDSWGTPHQPDCCTWEGVSCSTRSSHVIELHLSGDPYEVSWGCLDTPVLSSSLGELKHLQYLDLSSNYFPDVVIPTFIGSLLNLVYLNLSSSSFSGNIPNQLANLTRLTSLDLSHNEGLSTKSLDWLSHLTSLRHINLGGADLSQAEDWSQSIDNLPFLEVLRMDDSQLSTPLPSPPSSSSGSNKSANLRIISLSGNDITGFSTLKWLFNGSNHSSLVHLDLSHNFLQGPIPYTIGNSKVLAYLDLSHNSLSNAIPDAIGNLENVTYLDISQNSLSNAIPDAIGNLNILTYLDLSHNSLSNVIPDAIGNLRLLTDLNFSNNLLSGGIPLGALWTLNSLVSLNLSHNRFEAIHDSHSIQNSSGGLALLGYLDLSYNRLEGSIPSAIADLVNVSVIDLSNNHLEGTIPASMENLTDLAYLDLSNNQLEGLIPNFFGELSVLSCLRLSNNHLQGTTPASMAKLNDLEYLDLSNNQLEGSIPSSLGELFSLSCLRLSNNHLQGTIPTSMEKLNDLEYLDLSNNELEGLIPSSLGELSSLSYLRLSNNHLQGTIPASIAELGNLKYLDLSSNNLSGDIPCQIGDWGYGYPYPDPPAYINFSFNNLSGSIPNHLSKFGLEAFQGNPSLRPGGVHNFCDATSPNKKQVEGAAGAKIHRNVGLYVSIGLGLYTGFWVVCGTLTLKNSWRHAYFRFLDDMADEIYVFVAVYRARFLRNFHA